MISGCLAALFFLPATGVWAMAQINMQNNTKARLNLFIDGYFGCGPVLPNGFCTSSVAPGPHLLEARKGGDPDTAVQSETVTIGDGMTPTWIVNGEGSGPEGGTLDDSLPEPLPVPAGIPADVQAKYSNERAELLRKISRVKAKIGAYNAESEADRTDYQKQNLTALRAVVAQSVKTFNWEMETLKKSAEAPKAPTFNGRWRQSTQNCGSAIEITEDAEGNVSNSGGTFGKASGNTLVYQQQVFNPDTQETSPADCTWTLSEDGQSYTYHLSCNDPGKDLTYIRCP
jgi:hypothetical protein